MFMNRLMARIMRLFSPGKTRKKPKQLRDGGPVTLSKKAHDSPTATVAIYSSTRLRRRNGYWSEQKIWKALSNALYRAEINYEITWGFDETFDPPDEDIYAGNWDDGDGTIYWWAETEKPVEADAHLLLMEDDGGVTLGRSCLGGAKDIGRWDEPKHIVHDGGSTNVFSCLHEVGHALGVGRDADTTTEQIDTYGKSWIQDGAWHKTLMVSTDEAEWNVCGKTIVPNHEEQRPVVYHNRFSDCAANEIKRTLTEQ